MVDDWPRFVCFNKPTLCEGEPFKVVASSEKHYDHRKFVLQLYSLNNEAEDLLNETVLSTLGSDDRRKTYFQEVKTLSGNIRPGSYIARVFAPLADLPDESVEQYLLAEHPFQVIPYEDYMAVLPQMFGDDWDEPVYLDSEIEHLNELFRSWRLEPLHDYEISRRGDQNVDSSSRGSKYGGWSSGPESYEGSLLGRIEGLLRASMSEWGESYPPFSMDVDRLAGDLPHVDLTKLLWVVNVLASTLTDIMFFCGRVRSILSAKDDSISLELVPSYEDPQEELLMPGQEPPIFQVVRDAVVGLNLQLTYAESKGVSLSIKANRSPLSLSALQY
jgi:hypothetical protein